MVSERDVMEAWDIYQKLQKPLSNVSHSGGDPILLYTSLHHLIRLLSAITPRSEVLCSRIISAMSTLRRVGGRIHPWERRLLRAIVKEQNLHPKDLEHLEDLIIVDALPPAADPGASNTAPLTSASPSEDGPSSIFNVPPPQHLSEIDLSEEFHLPIPVAPVPTTFTQDHERARLLNVIGVTQSFDEAWDAYRAFSSQPLAEDPSLNKYPSRHLHRLVSLLATVRPRTRKVYLSLASIMSTLRASGYLIYPWEWNLLMDASAKGWRKTRFEDYKTSLQVFNDMLAYQKEVRGSDDSPLVDQNVRPSSYDQGLIPTQNNLAPDIYSYTTLISHAARTLSPRALEHARSLLNSAGIIPNRVTLLAQLRLHTSHNQMFGVRRTIAEIQDRGLTLDIYGVNSIIWAFARNEHMEVAEAIYRVLRSNIDADDSVFDGIDEQAAAGAKFLDEVENIVIPPTVIPNGITYTTLIQSYAYQGDLTRTLQIFADMLSSSDPILTWKGEVGAATRFLPVMQVFRAIFLGFYRHGVDPMRPVPHHRGHHRSRGNHEGLDWNLDNLYAIYKGFLELPADQKPGDKVVYWLIMALEKCSGGDYLRMREMWTTVEGRWGDRWGSRLRRVRGRIYHNTEHAEAGGDDDVLGDESDDRGSSEGFRACSSAHNNTTI
jgi:pentatricopeptide repeat protein